jgi:hypothetical protein
MTSLEQAVALEGEHTPQVQALYDHNVHPSLMLEKTSHFDPMRRSEREEPTLDHFGRLKWLSYSCSHNP